MSIDPPPVDDRNDSNLLAALEVGDEAIRNGGVVAYSSELLDEIERCARDEMPSENSE